jgi:choline dehydrogenase-like flavoprotein
MDRADVVIIGAGAAGAAAAWRLATQGVSVVCLEQGDWLDQSNAPSLTQAWERALQTRFHPNPNIRRAPADYPVADDDTPIRPALYNGVGGSTLRWGAHFPRLRPSDFRVRSLDGVAADWPISYTDLEPYYDLNDRMMGVAGIAGDPANPPRARRPTPPLPLGSGGKALARAFDELGWHWWPSDAAIVSAPYGARHACNHCGPCGVGCPRQARASTDITYWPDAIAAGARLEVHARVRRILRDGARASGVDYIDGAGQQRIQHGRIVALAANGMGSARLLLASDLANSSDLVGRGLMHHPTAIVTGVFAERLDGHKGAFACALYCQEFAESDRARGFARGYQMQMLRGGGPLQTALGGYMARLPWGSAHHARFTREFARTVSLTITAEDLPEPENRVTLDPVLRDSAGIPAPRLRYRVSDNSGRMLDHGIARASAALRKAGAIDVVVNPLAAQGGFHFLGTTRMGDDRAYAVTDCWGATHDIANLFVLDGGLFVTSGPVNPTPTIQALALRAADRIAAILKGSA